MDNTYRTVHAADVGSQGYYVAMKTSKTIHLTEKLDQLKARHKARK